MKRELKSLRVGAGLTQAELAKRLGVTNVTVSRWERGEAVPKPKYIKAMAKLFNIKGQDIFLNLITTKVYKTATKIETNSDNKVGD
ncbi:helix-turn-helix transcriptional regulator [Lactobacillus gasseri]|jgi:hypothetical protein|nr:MULTISPECIES: helix-turn-helix transcriptional regulator [Lactobacillus]KDA99143.1 XRE family transcriptional regulator [Lactobacillus paragasseri K7]MCZ3537282.1 helix-turn-helix transcriptional regulator [Lactobacillus gasseri]MCZ3538927.1 helix-turn-helix transcriptional regulator [Lactobacillus gasseri]MCZ3546118.1 helix-turn-helix transcriptional regulator [Lactobacillus gasseri]MCZ3548003.1 helix-turn-helix transcriptional regulator [Lactobacillus gasseri]